MTKVFVVANYVRPRYRHWLTPMKKYEVIKLPCYGSNFAIRRDDGSFIYPKLKDSVYISRNWRVIVQPPTRRITMEEYRAMEGSRD